MNEMRSSQKMRWNTGAAAYSLNILIICTVVALAVGFFGGMKFGEKATQKMATANTMEMPSMNETPMGQMPPASQGTMQGAMPGNMNGAPGPVNIDVRQAIPKMEQMLTKDPTNYQLLVHLGNLYYDINDFQKAVDTYEKALAIDRKDPNVLTDCAVMYRNLHKIDKAEAYLNEAQKINPNHFESKYNLGIVYREDRKQYAKALGIFKELQSWTLKPDQEAQVKIDFDKTKALMK